MTVGELIKKLQCLYPELDVCVADFNVTSYSYNLYNADAASRVSVIKNREYRIRDKQSNTYVKTGDFVLIGGDDPPQG